MREECGAVARRAGRDGRIIPRAAIPRRTSASTSCTSEPRLSAKLLPFRWLLNGNWKRPTANSKGDRFQ